MPASFNIYNAQGIEQVNSSQPVGGIISKTTVPSDVNGIFSTTYAPLPLPATLEAPLILGRVPIGHWIGGLVMAPPVAWAPNGLVNISCTAAVEVAFAYQRGTPMLSDGPNTAGIELYDENGVLTFSSRYRYPRLVHILAPRGPGTFGFASPGEHPWMVLNNLSFGYDASEFGPNKLLAARLNGWNSISIEARDAMDIRNGWADPSFANTPYARIPLHIPIAVIPGL